MKSDLTIALLLISWPLAYGQDAPSAITGPTNLSYAVRYSQTAEFGGSLGDWQTITPSASLRYSRGKDESPFSLQYTGGYTSTLSGPAYATGAFQHLLISQEIDHDRWGLWISDDVGYWPQSPTTGFSGIPGIGEAIGGEVTPQSNQLILTVNTKALDNAASAGARRILNHSSTLNVEASHNFLHYPDNNGFDTASLMTAASIDFRLNARNSLSTRYANSRFTYSGYDFTVSTNMVTEGLTRFWKRSLQTTIAAGPEWVNSSKSAALPGSTGLAVQAHLQYDKRQTSMSVNYTRGTTGGSGYMIGSRSYDLSGGLSRKMNRTLEFGMDGGYRHTSQLVRDWEIFGSYGGFQASWLVGKRLNAFINYTATSQSSNAAGPSNILNEVMHTISCGIGFTGGRKSR